MRMQTIFSAPSVILLVLFHSGSVTAALLAEFDITNAQSNSTTAVPVVTLAPGVTSSPLVPLNVSGGGVSSTGLYWSSSWPTGGANPFVQRQFFNLVADSVTLIEFNTLDFFASSGDNNSASYELRVFGSGGSTIGSPQLVQQGSFLSTNLAAPVSIDVSSLPTLHDGVYQFSLSFFNRDPSKRIGLTGDRSDIGVPGGNLILDGEANVIPEPAAFAVWSLLGMTFIGAGYWRRRCKAVA